MDKTSLKKIKRRILSRHLWLARISVFLAAVFVFVVLIFGLLQLVKLTPAGKYLVLGKNFLTPSTSAIKSLDNRSNILILGKAGEGYTAPDLTDTIILFSVSLDKARPEVDMISLPRDIWLSDLEAKLNSVYYWGNKRQTGGGLILAKSVVEQITGVPVHYAIVLDFNGFKDIIDLMGGVEVQVKKSFVDERYPIAGKENDLCGGDPSFDCRYETIRFEKGLQHMDGEMALKFVRSRHSEDLEEGTDFARSQRQQAVIKAIQKKLLSREMLTQPQKLWDIWQQGNAMIETDLTDQEKAILGRFVYDARNNINTHSIPEDLLELAKLSGEFQGLYAFSPVAGPDNWTQIQSWVHEVLK